MEPGRIGVIFDCDGTLLDSMDVWREVEDELARRAGAQLTKTSSPRLTSPRQVRSSMTGSVWAPLRTTSCA